MYQVVSITITPSTSRHAASISVNTHRRTRRLNIPHSCVIPLELFANDKSTQKMFDTFALGASAAARRQVVASRYCERP